MSTERRIVGTAIVDADRPKHNPLVRDNKPQAAQSKPIVPETVGVTKLDVASVFNFNKSPERVSDVVLPSLGLLYENGVPGGLVKMRAMTVKERKLTVGFKGSWTELIDLVLSRALVDCKVPSSDFSIQDRLFLLMMLRVISYGDSISFKVQCDSPECKLEFDTQLSLINDMKLVQLSPDKAVEPYRVDLSNGNYVMLRYIRGKDEREIAALMAGSKSQVGDLSFVYRLVKHIKSINDVPVVSGNLNEAVKLVESLDVNDERVINKAINEHDYGVDITVDVKCPSCTKLIGVEVPWMADFFRPF